MPRRVITSEYGESPKVHNMSITSMAIWPFVLAATDDFGVVIADPFKLALKAYIPDKLKRYVPRAIQEFTQKGLGLSVQRNGDSFFVFNPNTFDRIQWHIIKSRTRSSCLDLDEAAFIAEIVPLFANNETLPVTSGKLPEPAVNYQKDDVEIKDSRLEIKEERGSGGKPTTEYAPKVGEPIQIRTFEERLPDALKTPPFLEQWRAWVRMRHGPHGKSGKPNPVTENKADLAIKELGKLAGDPVEIVEQSAVKEWDSFFPLTGHKAHDKPKSQYQQRSNFKLSDTAANFGRLRADLEAVDRARGVC